MDLGTILKKLLSSGYPTLLDFHEDVSQTFENAMAYNPAGTPVHGMALELKEIFETNFLDLLDQLETELIEKEKKDDARLAI
jgi:Bromodomain